MNKINSFYYSLLVDHTATERIANLIKKLRGNKSQRQFARVLGVSYASIRSWEQSESMPSLQSLQLIAAYSNQRIEELLDYISNNGEDKSNIKELDKIYLAEDILEAIEKMPKVEKTKLIKLLINDVSK